MAKKNPKGITMLTPEFRVSYPAVFEPKFNKLSKQMEYSIVALFKKGQDLSKLLAAADKVTKERWAKKVPKKFKNPFKDQAEAEKENEETGETFMPDGYKKGAIMLRMKTKEMPEIRDLKNQKKPITDPAEFYAGCYAIADVYINSYDIEDGMSTGVSVSLNSLLKTRDGDPFSGKRKAEEAFAAIEADEDEEESTDSDDDDEDDDDGHNPFA